MTRKVIGIVFGSRKDLDHVQQVTAQIKERGWTYSQMQRLYNSNAAHLMHPKVLQAYTVAAGSAHRDTQAA